MIRPTTIALATLMGLGVVAIAEQTQAQAPRSPVERRLSPNKGFWKSQSNVQRQATPQVVTPRVYQQPTESTSVIREKPVVVQPKAEQPRVVQPQAVQPRVVQPQVVQPRVVQPQRTAPKRWFYIFRR